MLYKNIYYTNKDSNCISRMSKKKKQKGNIIKIITILGKWNYE